MISEQSQPVFQPVAASQSTPQPVSVNVQTYNPCEPPTQVQRQATRAPTQNSTYQPPPVKGRDKKNRSKSKSAHKANLKLKFQKNILFLLNCV
jgi:hypothetical protein